MEGFHAYRDGRLNLSGWDAVDATAIRDAVEQMTEEQFAQALELASLYRQCFATEAGRRVLEDLSRMFLMQRVVRPDDTQFAAGIRQGQVDVVARCLAMIEFANTGGGQPTGAGANQE